MRIGLDKIPLPLVLVRCQRCHKTAGLFSAAAGEAGSWSHKDDPRRRCHCAQPPTLPMGAELDGLVALAWSKTPDGRHAPVVVYR